MRILSILLALLVPISSASARSVLGRNDRINLADFGRVVKVSGQAPDTLEVQTLVRGKDGWPAWKIEAGPHAGEYAIAVEWDEPRDIAAVNIEFRHAIANRHEIRPQYFHRHWPHNGAGGWARLDDPFHGEWVDVRGEWWAGDRDVSFEFGPYAAEHPDDPNAPDFNYRRTYRFRFLLGKREPPPVRYIRAYAPSKHCDATFTLDWDDESPVELPVDASVINGYLLDPTTGETSQLQRLDRGDEALRVRFYREDDATATRTIVTLRRADDRWTGFSFLPAEAMRNGRLNIPAMGVTVRHADHEADRASGLSDVRQVYDRIPEEPQQTWTRARAEIPAMEKAVQTPEPMYLPLAPPLSRQEVAVRYDGTVLLSREALKSPAEDNTLLRWPEHRWRLHLKVGHPPADLEEEGFVRQQLLENTLPILINTWEHRGIRYEQTCVATYLEEPADARGDETVVLLVRLTVTNSTNQAKTTEITLYEDAREFFTLRDGHVYANARQSDGVRSEYDEPLYRFFLKADESIVIKPDVLGMKGMPPCLRADVKLSPGQKSEMQYRVPYVTLTMPQQRERIAALDFEEVLARETHRWREILDRSARIEVPDPLLNDFYRAQLAHVFITADRDPHNGTWLLPAATLLYNVCLNETCHQVRSLEMRGLHNEAAKFLDAAVRGQSTRPLQGRFKSSRGVFHGLPSKDGDYQRFNYNLDHGFVLWMLNEHYRFTRDEEWLRDVADALVEGCDFIIRERDVPDEANTLAKTDEYWGRGLLPPGHLEDPPEWLWWFAVNAYAYRGLRDSAASLEQIGHPEAHRLTTEAMAFGKHLRLSCKEAMIRAPVVRMRDGTYLPFQPTRSRLRGRDLGWIRDALYGPIHLIDCGVIDRDSPEAEWMLRDAEDNVFVTSERGRRLDDFEKQWFSWGGITLQSNLLPNPLVYMKRRQPDYAVRAFTNSLAANVFEDVRTFTEHPIEAYGIGQGPFFKSPDESAFIVWFRSLLMFEDGGDLLLLAGAPDEWLEPGKTIRVEDAPTWFGPMSLDVQSQQERIRLILDPPTRNPPRAIHLRVPLNSLVRSVRVNEEPYEFEGQKWIALKQRVSRTQVDIEY